MENFFDRDDYKLNMNLQFFAEDGPGGEKTEEPTAKKLEDARKKGQVAKSKDLTGGLSLLALFVVLKVYVGFMGNRFLGIFYYTYTAIGDLHDKFGSGAGMTFFGALFKDILLNMLILVLPFFAASFMIALIADLVQVKWKPTSEPLKPKLNKINPLSGFKRIFSVKTLVNLIKQIAIIILMFVVIYSQLKNKVGYLFNLYDISLNSAIMLFGDIVINIGIIVSVIYLIIGFADFIYEKRKFKKDMRMTKQEIKEEWKNTEGSPEVKQKQRQRMREVSQRRMMQAVPEADVVITNPTHFAVALKYDRESGKAPIVIAKGEDFLAAKIKEAAKEANVEIVENRPVARMLYYNVELGQEIPPELYQAVAEILAYVYNLKHGPVTAHA